MVDHPLGFPAPPLRQRSGPVDPYWIEPAWVSEGRRRRRRLLIAGAVGLVAVLAIVAAFVVLNARANYIAGKQALAAGDYGLAIRRLHAATIVGRPYADARTLLAQAVTFSTAQSLTAGQAPTTAASRSLRRAAALFEAGRYAEAERVAGDLAVRLPPVVAARLAAAGDGAVAGLLLLTGAQHALAAGNPSLARRDAAAVLLRFPECAPAQALRDEAARRLQAAPFAGRAAALAAARRWSLARTAVRTTLRIDPAYPGMAVLLQRIDAAITQRKAAKAAAAAAAAAASSSSNPVTSTPTAPAAPQPPPP